MVIRVDVRLKIPIAVASNNIQIITSNIHINRYHRRITKPDLQESTRRKTSALNPRPHAYRQVHPLHPTYLSPIHPFPRHRTAIHLTYDPGKNPQIPKSGVNKDLRKSLPKIYDVRVRCVGEDKWINCLARSCMC